MRSGRALALLLIAAAVVAALTLDRDDDGPEPRDPRDAVPVMPMAAPPGTLSSTWFCAAGTARDGGSADHVVVVANPSELDLVGIVTVLGGSVAPAPPVPPGAEGTATTAADATTTTAAPTPPPPDPVSERFELPARGRVEIRLGDLLESQLAGAVVEVNGGAVAVEHQVTGDLGRATAPCATTTSETWTFPWGVTTRGNRELLVFMNPFPDDATVDVDFVTEEGVRETVRFSGFVVPARGVVGAFIDQDVQRRAHVSAHVTVRSGRVVVERLQTFSGTDGRRGITVGLGAPSPAPVWTFPDGQVGDGLTEQVVVFNPGEAIAEVEVEVRLVDPDENGVPEPFQVSVPPRRFSVLDLHDQDRVPGGVPHSTVVRSLNGEPVVVERVVAASDPSAREGISAMLGSPVHATTWLFAGGGPTDERDHWITLVNPDAEAPVTVSVVGLAGGQELALQDLQGIEVPPAGRLAVRLGESTSREALPVVVRADGPVVAERGLYRVGGLGLSTALGVPLEGTTEVPAPLG